MQVSAINTSLANQSSVNFGKKKKDARTPQQPQTSQQQKPQVSVPNGMVLLPVATVLNMAAAAGSASATVPVQPYNEPQPVDKTATVTRRTPYISNDLRVVRNFDPSRVDMTKTAKPFQMFIHDVRPNVVQWKSAPFESDDGNTYTMYFTNPAKHMNHNNRTVHEIYLVSDKFVPRHHSPGDYGSGDNSPPRMIGIILHSDGVREKVGLLCYERDNVYGDKTGEIPVPPHIADAVFDLVNGENPNFDSRVKLRAENLIETSDMSYRPFSR